MLAMFDSALVHGVGWALLHLLWQASAVGLVLAGLLALLRRQAAAVRYVVACGALLLVAVLPVITIWNSVRSEIKPGGADSEQSSSGTPTGSFPLLELQAPMTAEITGNGAAPPLSSYHEFPALLERYLPLIVGLWLLGVLCASAKLMFAWMRLRRLATRSTPASPEWQQALARLRRRIRLSVPVRLWESAAVEVPTVIGWIRPIILLPVTALTGLSRQQLETIIAHELAHIRRHDFLINLLQTAVETLLFYHPAVWWISSQIRIEREHCCDDLAVEICGNPLLYARALADLEQTRFPSSLPAVALSGGSLLRRVRRLIAESPRKCSARWLAGVSIMTVVVGLALAAPLSLLAIHDQDETPRSSGAAQDRSALAAPAQTTITVSADDECRLPEDCEDQVAIESEYHQAAAVHAVVADVAARVLPVSTQLAPLVAHSAGHVLAYALAAAEPQKTPRPPAVQAPAVAPRPMATPKPPKPVKWNADQDFDFDFDFDFDYDFEFEYDFDFDEPQEAKARQKASERDKPLNRAALTVDELIRLKSLGITAQYLEEMEKAGFANLSLSDLMRLKSAGVTADYVKEVREAGYPGLTASELMRLRSAGLNAKFIAEANSIAGKKLSVRELLRMKHNGIDRKFIEELARGGFRGLSVEELVRWKAMGVTPEFATEMKAAGFANVSVAELIALRSAGVTADYVRALREAGLTNLEPMDVVKLRHAGVDADFIKQMKKPGN